jgi:hypothetical protein
VAQGKVDRVAGNEGAVQGAGKALGAQDGGERAHIGQAAHSAGAGPAKTAPGKPNWLDRIQQGNRLLTRLFPELVSPDDLPEDADYSRAPLLVAPCDGATAVVLTFGGNTGYLMLPPGLVTLPNTHVIAIRDPKRCFALCGIPGLGQTYAACLTNLRVMMAELGATDLFCAGVSAGGFPAMRYGLDLGAAGVLGFSVPTTLDLADETGADLSNYPQLTALYRNRPDMPLDLARPYAATVPRPRAILVYSPSNDRDSWLAARMGGTLGVEVSAISDEAGHRVFQWLSVGNGITQYLGRLLSLRPVTADDVKKTHSSQ